MRTEVQEKSITERILKVELPEEVVNHKLEEVYRKTVRDLELPGFRRGKVPRRLLEIKFGKDFLYEDSQKELLAEYLPKALKEGNLEPVSEPLPKVIQFEEGKPFVFEVEVEVLPEAKVSYLEVEVEPPPRRRVTKREVALLLEELRLKQAAIIPKEGKVEDGDIVLIRLNGGEHEIKVNKDDKFTSQLIGAAVGDEVKIKLEVEGTEERVAKILELKEIELPPLDDEFARAEGYSNLAELEEWARKELKERFKAEYQQQMRFKILDTIVANTDVSVPKRMKEELVKKASEDAERVGIALSKKEHEKQVEQQIKREIVIESIKKAQGLMISPEQFEELLSKEADRRGMNPTKFKALLEKEGRLNSFKKELEREKVLDYLYKKALIKSKSKKE
jgi:trigger factor